MIKLRITPDGRIRGLWSDAVNLLQIGACTVRRASHVEFDERRQRWCVREALPIGRFRRLVRRLLRGTTERSLYHAVTRSAALKWEHQHFQPGGQGWDRLGQSAW